MHRASRTYKIARLPCCSKKPTGSSPLAVLTHPPPKLSLCQRMDEPLVALVATSSHGEDPSIDPAQGTGNG
jgi:hypothetical protein